MNRGTDTIDEDELAALLGVHRATLRRYGDDRPPCLLEPTGARPRRIYALRSLLEWADRRTAGIPEDQLRLIAALRMEASRD